MRKFCFVCGKRTEVLINGKCEDCFKKSEYVDFPKRMDVVICSKCKKMLLKNKWVDINLEKIIECFIKIRHHAKIKKIEARREAKSIVADFFLSDHSGNEITETHEAVFHENRIICPSCSRKHSGYYEAVLQLRGFDDKDLESMADIFERIGKKTFYRIREVKGGFDAKIGGKLAINSAANDIRKRFPRSEKKESSKIVTKIDGRDVHRKFVLIRKIRKE